MYTLQTFDSREISEPLVREVSDYYRYIFNNNGHYLVYPETFEFISPREWFGAPEGERVSLRAMDSMEEQDYPRHPRTGERAILWHHPRRTEAAMREKFERDATLIRLRGERDRQIVGFSFGYRRDASAIFEQEGWRSPYYYADPALPHGRKSLELFLTRVNATLRENPDVFGEYLALRGPLHERSMTYAWNCTGKSVRGRDALYSLMRAFFTGVPRAFHDDLVFGDARVGARGYHLFGDAGFVDVPGVLQPGALKEGDSILQVSTFRRVSAYFLAQAERHFSS